MSPASDYWNDVDWTAGDRPPTRAELDALASALDCGDFMFFAEAALNRRVLWDAQDAVWVRRRVVELRRRRAAGGGRRR